MCIDNSYALLLSLTASSVSLFHHNVILCLALPLVLPHTASVSSNRQSFNPFHIDSRSSNSPPCTSPFQQNLSVFRSLSASIPYAFPQTSFSSFSHFYASVFCKPIACAVSHTPQSQLH